MYQNGNMHQNDTCFFLIQNMICIKMVRGNKMYHFDTQVKPLLIKKESQALQEWLERCRMV